MRLPASHRRRAGLAPRTEALGRLKVPALVIHGTADPLLRPAGGRATGRAIPGAKLLRIEGLGHHFPSASWPLVVNAIASMTGVGERGRAAGAG